jgi:hypothetical protein
MGGDFISFDAETVLSFFSFSVPLVPNLCPLSLPSNGQSPAGYNLLMPVVTLACVAWRLCGTEQQATLAIQGL